MSGWVHEVKQPMTAIVNYASASKTLLSESLRLSTPISAADARRIIQWMDEISAQTTRTLKLVEEQNRIWKEQSLTPKANESPIAPKDPPKLTS